MKQTDYYLQLLKKENQIQSFYNASKKCLEDNVYSEQMDLQTIYQTSTTVVGPVLSAYVLWVLQKSQEKHYQTLYFLARDGQIMYKIAQIINTHLDLNLNLRYLYVSRLALRKSIYALNKEEALQMICRDGLQASPDVIMKRTGLSDEACIRILAELGYSNGSQYTLLSNEGLIKFKQLLRQNVQFDKYMTEFSKAQLKITRSYLLQEGLDGTDTNAIVDSGWTGSIQRSIREILQYGQNTPIKLNGFYFGIQTKTDPIDGIYHCFYFTGKKRDTRQYILFNNNLFECWCMASHGMTIGYEKQYEIITPMLKPYQPFWYEAYQEKFILQFVNTWTHSLDIFKDSVGKNPSKQMRRLIVHAMMFPSKEEARVYGRIPFCDDSSESYYISLARELSYKDLFFNLTFMRFLSRCFSHSHKRHFSESAWKEGTIALLPPFPSLLMRFDCYLSYLAKLLLNWIK